MQNANETTRPTQTEALLLLRQALSACNQSGLQLLAEGDNEEGYLLNPDADAVQIATTNDGDVAVVLGVCLDQLISYTTHE